jgi:2,4-dienoyl-CoA reductase-like NADH-dependent reductase (Old Yellow Enzyme family)
MPLDEVVRIARNASTRCRKFNADAAAERLNVTYAERAKLGLTTIGSIDVNKAGRETIRKEKKKLHDKEYASAKRKAAGRKTRKENEENSLCATKSVNVDQNAYFRHPGLPPPHQLRCHVDLHANAC